MDLLTLEKIKLNRLKKEKMAEQKIVLQENEKDSQKRICQILRQLINDEKYQAYKLLLETRLNTILEKRKSLIYTSSDNDQYLRFSIIYDTEIALLTDILKIPENFFENEKKINQLAERRSSQ